MNNNFYIVLMAGGKGTRLWPVSREAKPKQFHKFNSDKTLLQETYERSREIVDKHNIYVSLGQNTLRETQAQLPNIPKNNFIVEPESKNTAPSIALVTAKIFKTNPSAIIGTISTDHTIGRVREYQQTIQKAFNFINKNPEYLMTVGIKPDSPHTGYGYIKVGKKFPESSVYQGLGFVEKPNLETAKKYLTSDNFLWNASYFIFRADQMIHWLEEFEPKIYQMIKNILPAIGTSKEERETSLAFQPLEATPIDIAIAEKVKKLAVIPADMNWSDVGSWASLHDLLSQKENGHLVIRGHHIGVNDQNCLFFSENKLLATIGLENIIIVDTPDVTLVCNKEKTQDVKLLIEKLTKEGKKHYL